MRYDLAWSYALTCDGYAYAAERLDPEGKDFNDLYRPIEASGWDAPFEKLRICLFFLQRSHKWLGGSAGSERKIHELEAKYMDCYRAACIAWEQGAAAHRPEIKASYAEMAQSTARYENIDESEVAGANLQACKLRSTMPPQYTPHKKFSLRRHPQFNEAWLHDRICDDPALLGLGDAA